MAHVAEHRMALAMVAMRQMAMMSGGQGGGEGDGEEEGEGKEAKSKGGKD